MVGLVLGILATMFAVLPARAGAAEPGRPCPGCPILVEIPSPSGQALLMSRGEISFDEWEACVQAKACRGGQDDHGWGRGARPVINVSWHDAQAYAAWLGSAAGLDCRLPAPDEWEHAARGGRPSAFWWGDEPGSGMANCRDCNPRPIYGTTPAGTFPPNPFGLADMHGNVWEWTSGCRQDGCAHRIVKGGSWYYTSRNMRPENGSTNHAASGSYNIGIRVVCFAGRH